MTNTRKIIIEIQGELTEFDALEYVKSVMVSGRISRGRYGNDFCRLTFFDDEVEVRVREKQYKSGPDSFIVRKSPAV